ncbi:MAG: di-heme oxidoredictase family protein [Leucothrix sp.]
MLSFRQLPVITFTLMMLISCGGGSSTDNEAVNNATAGTGSTSGTGATGNSSTGSNTNNGAGSNTGTTGTGSSASQAALSTADIKPLYGSSTELEPIASYVREDGVVVTRIGDRGRDRHAKDRGAQDHYDHYLAHYWEYRTARIQLEDFVPNGESRIKATFITEAKLGAREFRVWFWGQTTSAQFHFNPQKEEQKVNPNETGVVYVGKGTWDNDFNKVSNDGIQHMYTLDIVNQWQNGGQFQTNLTVGTNMEFEVSQFLLSPPAGSRLNYYGTSFVYKIGESGLKPFEWQRGVNKAGGSNDGTPIPAKGLLGGDTTLGYNYTNEPAGRFMQMATNLSHRNAQPFVRGRRVHHTNFEDGSHDERSDNPIWTDQIGKAGDHYINDSCAACHVRNGRALVADVGASLDKWVFKVGDASGNADPKIGKVLQPDHNGAGESEGDVTLGDWTIQANGLRSPNYVFSKSAPAAFSARIAPQLVGIGLLEAIEESTILEWADPEDSDNNGISGRAALTKDPVSNETRLGRFGYKAATFSTKHHVASALNTDMGVMTSLLPNPDCGSEQVNCGNTGKELADSELDDLVKYISLLGVGARRDYADTAGEMIFNTIGCGSCHRASMTTSQYHPLAELRSQTIQPYTDLLLHDMGEGLADSLGEGNAAGAEWRTAPLWGLGHARSVMLGDAKGNDTVSLAREADDVNRIGYLHDGRARTIDEAIRWHGGEGLKAKEAYEALSASDKNKLLAFLKSL